MKAYTDMKSYYENKFSPLLYKVISKLEKCMAANFSQSLKFRVWTNGHLLQRGHLIYYFKIVGIGTTHTCLHANRTLSASFKTNGEHLVYWGLPAWMHHQVVIALNQNLSNMDVSVASTSCKYVFCRIFVSTFQTVSSFPKNVYHNSPSCFCCS